jgi:hypothetical protein
VDEKQTLEKHKNEKHTLTCTHKKYLKINRAYKVWKLTNFLKSLELKTEVEKIKKNLEIINLFWHFQIGLLKTFFDLSKLASNFHLLEL